ncbi:MAG: hypothetical protein VB862_05605 [Pirellulaceae bacterium]
MSILSLRDLATVTDARLYLGDLPPLGGDLETVNRIDFDLDTLAPGGLYWDLSHSSEDGFGKAEVAFLKGAAGVLVDRHHSEPWAGRYTLRVNNSQLAIRQLAYFLRQAAQRQTLLLWPAVAGQPWLAAMRALLERPMFGETGSRPPAIASATELCSSNRLRVLTLDNLPAPSVYATLLLAAPSLLVLGRSDGRWLAEQSQQSLCRIIESLPPDGAMLYCGLSDDCSTGTTTATAQPAWMRVFIAAGIRCLQIGSKATADPQVIPTPQRTGSHMLVIGELSLSLGGLSYEQGVATATAFGAALLLGYEPTAVIERLGSPCRQHLPPSLPSSWTWSGVRSTLTTGPQDAGAAA